MVDWNIQSRSRRCQACEQPFADKTPYYTLLFQQRQHLERLDVCEKCWTSQYSQGATDRKGYISFWHGIFSVPPPPPAEPIPKENAEGLLRRLCADADPNLAAVRYILAAMLERKRILKVKAQTAEAGQRVFVYEHVRSGDLFTILDPELRLDQLEVVQQQAALLLEQNPVTHVHADAAPAYCPPPQEAAGQNPVCDPTQTQLPPATALSTPALAIQESTQAMPITPL
jgi:hypothetical protein